MSLGGSTRRRPVRPCNHYTRAASHLDPGQSSLFHFFERRACLLTPQIKKAAIADGPSNLFAALFVQAACAFRFLRQPSRPSAPRPVAKNGRAAGRGVGTAAPCVMRKKLMPAGAKKFICVTLSGALPSALANKSEKPLVALVPHSAHQFRPGSGWRLVRLRRNYSRYLFLEV